MYLFTQLECYRSPEHMRTYIFVFIVSTSSDPIHIIVHAHFAAKKVDHRLFFRPSTNHRPKSMNGRATTPTIATTTKGLRSMIELGEIILEFEFLTVCIFQPVCFQAKVSKSVKTGTSYYICLKLSHCCPIYHFWTLLISTTFRFAHLRTAKAKHCF